jgi:hypothetical protein
MRRALLFSPSTARRILERWTLVPPYLSAGATPALRERIEAAARALPEEFSKLK